MAVLFRPGEEIMNSHTDTKTLLLKNNWYLPDNQKISLQYMDNKIGFGEINPLITAWILGFAEQSLDETCATSTGDRDENRQQNLQNRLRMETAE